MGPEGLAAAIRKADPSYKPALDPGPSAGPGGACPLGFNDSHWPAVFAAVVVVLILVSRSRKDG
jgi:hypothetical protein